jgi:hypothetical protein
MYKHFSYSSGSIFESGFLSIAAFQLAISSSLWMTYQSRTAFNALLGNLPVTTPVSISTVISYSPYSA